MSSRMSTRSMSECGLMEAIYDDDYFAGEETAEDVGQFDIKFKRSEKLSTGASGNNDLAEDSLAYVRNKKSNKHKSLFNSEFDEETEALFLADLPGNDDEYGSSDDEDNADYVGISSTAIKRNDQKQPASWSIFRGDVHHVLEDEELASLSDYDSSKYHEIAEIKSVAPPDPPKSPVAAWKASAAAGTDEGANVAAYQEESSVLHGEDTFLVVDYSDPTDNSRPEVKWFDGKESLAPSRVNPHHIPMLVSSEVAEENELVQPKILVKVTMSVKFQLLHGHDWSSADNSDAAILRKKLLKKAGQIHSKNDRAVSSEKSIRKHGHRVLFADEARVDKFGETVSKSPGIGKESNPPDTLSTHMNKDRAELSLHGVSVRFALYAPDEDAISTWPVQRTIVKINDIDVKFYRKNHRTKRILQYWKSQVPRESNAPILHIHLDTFVDTVSKAKQRASNSDHSSDEGKMRNEGVGDGLQEGSSGVEHVNKISIVLLPLSCHLDAPFLDLVRSLGESFKPGSEPEEKDKKISGQIGALDSTSEAPIIPSSVPISLSLNQLDRERPIFFQQWKMSPISFKIYYEPRTFDILKFQSGDYIEILNCFPLDGLEITMKKIVLYGVSGVQGGVDNTLRLWIDEIRDNQLSTIAKILSGVSPLKGVASIGRGLHHNLIVMPRKEFNRKGTSGAIQSVAGGIAAVGTTVFREALHAGAQATQILANLLSRINDPLVEEHQNPHDRRGRERISSRHSSQLIDSRRRNYPSESDNRGVAQPYGIADGGQLAYDALTTSMLSAVDNIVLVPIREFQRAGPGGAISSVIRAVPIAVLGPAAGAAQAVSYTFLGMRNQLDPARRKDEEAIYVDIEKPSGIR